MYLHAGLEKNLLCMFRRSFTDNATQLGEELSKEYRSSTVTEDTVTG